MSLPMVNSYKIYHMVLRANILVEWDLVQYEELVVRTSTI